MKDLFTSASWQLNFNYCLITTPFKNWFVLKTPWIFIAKICLESTTVTPVFNVGASEASFCLIQVNAIQFKVVHETISVIKKIICCI